MHRLDREQFTKKQYSWIWGTLGLQAGFINAFGFLACGRYVSHVTGVGTQLGISLAGKNIMFALELLGFPFFFILGAFANGILTSAKADRKESPRYDLVTLILPLMLLVLIALGEIGLFGPFGEDLLHARDFILLYSLAFFCGMQNACFATLTKGQIRTTHLTGISTDIGTDLARTWFGKLEETELMLTQRVNNTRIMTFAAFSFGSIVSVIVSSMIGYSALLVPLATSTLVFLVVRYISHIQTRKVLVTEDILKAKRTHLA